MHFEIIIEQSFTLFPVLLLREMRKSYKFFTNLWKEENIIFRNFSCGTRHLLSREYRSHYSKLYQNYNTNGKSYFISIMMMQF